MYSGVYFLCFTGFSRCYRVPCERTHSHTHQCGLQHNPAIGQLAFWCFCCYAEAWIACVWMWLRCGNERKFKYSIANHVNYMCELQFVSLLVHTFKPSLPTCFCLGAEISIFSRGWNKSKSRQVINYCKEEWLSFIQKQKRNTNIHVNWWIKY